MGDHSDDDEDRFQRSRLPRPSTPPGVPPPSSRTRDCKLSFGVVCSSNINRSMEAHVVFSNAGLNVTSYGTGTTVRLPGRSAMEPRVFKFGTPYAQMYDSLAVTAEDEAFFQHNGVLQLCKRGAAVKLAPQRWQDTPSEMISGHDIVVAFEERIFDAVVEDLQMREPTEAFAPIHVICLDTKDNPHEAKIQGRVALELCWLMEQAKNDLLVEAPLILEEFEEERMKHTQIKVLYQLCYL
mmetsp:Transcript_34166/g.50201  ORF Transcript_34166/g.50201 Transcript_34166/m.50201 type:complete len:239 (+) Transcript_34166:123-839(+)